MNNIKPVSQNILQHLRKLKMKKFRRETGLATGEGARLLSSALESNRIQIQEIVFSDSFIASGQSSDFFATLSGINIELFNAGDKIFKTLSDEETPSGLLFTFSFRNALPDLIQSSEPILIYLEKISDPGNLGTIIRTACWFGINTVLLSPESADPSNPKVIRASAGAIFDCNLYEQISFETVRSVFKSKGYKFIATIPSKGKSLINWHPDDKNIVFFGQEAEGLSEKIINAADDSVTIPGAGNVESLNLAAAVAVFCFQATMGKFEK